MADDLDNDIQKLQHEIDSLLLDENFDLNNLTKLFKDLDIIFSCLTSSPLDTPVYKARLEKYNNWLLMKQSSIQKHMLSIKSSLELVTNGRKASSNYLENSKGES